MPSWIPERTVGLAFEDWPVTDRQAWILANEPGDELLDGGLASCWKPKTRITAMRAYGNWLRYLKETARLDDVSHVGERLGQDNLRDYIRVLRARVASSTAVTQLRSLSQAVRAMDIDADRSLLKLAISRLGAAATPARDKTAALVSPQVLHDLGLKLMATWQDRDAHDPRLNAMDYRDGLMIAFLTLCPIRRENLAQMRIGEHLVFDADHPRVCFDGADTKGGKAIDVAFPASLVEALRFYLDHVRPMIARTPEMQNVMWPSLRNTPMAAHSIYTRITRVMHKHLGRHITPHLFRDAAATFIVEEIPDKSLMAAPTLQHATFETTRRHYIHGQQHKASRLYHAAVDTIIRKADNDVG